MKRIHSLIQLGKSQPSVESNADDAAVVTQPVEGQPTVSSTSDVLADEQKASNAQQQADEQTPADGSIPSTEVPGVATESGVDAGVVAPVATETVPELHNKVDTGDGSKPATPGDVIDNKDARADLGKVVSQEAQDPGVTAPVATETTPADNGKVDTGDGSQPATPGDTAGDPEKRADMPVGSEGKPAELAPELEQQAVKAPQTTDVAADPNNPDNDGKSGEGKADPVQTTSTEKSEQTGGAAPASTTSTEQSAVEGGKPSTEDLSPADIAQVASVAAAVGAATSGGETKTEAVADAVADGGAIAGSAGAGTPPPADIPAQPEGTPAAADAAAQTAADVVADGPTGDTPPGPNAGDAAATPAEAAQVAADLIKANPETAAEVAQAIDTVADAAVAATQGGEPPADQQPAQTEEQAADAAAATDANADAGNADEAAAEAALQEELNGSKDDREDDEDDLDDIDDLSDDVNASQESLGASIRLLLGLESVVETALQNGGLSDDAAQILQTVTNNVTEEQGLDDTDLGLESLVYADRRNATHYALDRLRATRESLEEELTISNEGFFDLFRSFSSKMKNWVQSSRRNIAAAKSSIKDKAKTATIRLPGDEGDFAAIAQRTSGTLTEVLGEYGKGAYNAATILTKLSSEMADGDNDYDSIGNEINNVNPGYPKSFTELAPSGMGDGKASAPLLGSFTLALSLDSTDSEADSYKVREHHQGEVNGAQALAALEDADKVVQAVAGFISTFDNHKKLAKGSSDVKVTGAALIASAFGPFALLSSDYRRLIYRQFTHLSDPQRKKAAEVVAAFELVKETADTSRKYVAEVLDIAGKVSG